MKSSHSTYSHINLLKSEKPVHAEVKSDRDIPRLYINKSEIYPIAVWSWKLIPNVNYFKDAGIRILHPILGLNSCWPEPESYDWSVCDKLFDDLLKAFPEAFFLPRILLDVPEWWKDRYPDELVVCAIPTKPEDKRMYRDVKYNEEGGWNWGIQFREPSLASSVWRTDMTRLYSAFLDHIEKSPLVARVIGYQVGSGIYGEWHYFMAEFLPDLAKPVIKKLGYSPGKEERLRSSFGYFRDPESEKDVIEYYRRFHEEICADAILHFARITKEVTAGRALCGTFYGYQLENVWIQEGGHLAPEKVFSSPDIDFIASPYSYQTTNIEGRQWWEHDITDDSGNYLGRTRGVGGDGGYRVLLESLKRHGKLYCVEIDPGTYLEPPPINPDGSGGTDIEKEQCMIGGVGSTTIEGTKRILRRDLGRVFVSGAGGWLFDFGPVMRTGNSWYSDKPIIDEVRRLTELGKIGKNLDLSSISEVAAVYDAKSSFITRHWLAEAPFPKGGRCMDHFSYRYLASQARAFHRLGAPMDYLYRFDLTSTDFTKYKLLFMVNLFYLSGKEAESIRSSLKDSGLTVVWFFAPGFISPGKIDRTQMELLTGYKFNVNTEPVEMLIKTVFINQNDGNYYQIGTVRSGFPRFDIIPQSDVKVYGTWRDSGEIAFAGRRVDGWNSVYIGAAPVPADILRELLQTAGVRLWSDKSDIVVASNDAAMFVATSGGSRTLTLPKAMKRFGTQEMTNSYTLDLEFGDVEIFYSEKRGDGETGITQ
jgi:hypothetical protein